MGGWEGEVGSENPNSCSLLFCPLLSILTRILPWQVPCPPLLINRGPVWTLGEKVPHGPQLVWKKLFMISLPSISFKHVQKGTLPMVILQLKSLSGCPTSLFVAYFLGQFLRLFRRMKPHGMNKLSLHSFHSNKQNTGVLGWLGC